jgi:hypothetical protein
VGPGTLCCNERDVEMTDVGDGLWLQGFLLVPCSAMEKFDTLVYATQSTRTVFSVQEGERENIRSDQL